MRWPSPPCSSRPGPTSCSAARRPRRCCAATWRPPACRPAPRSPSRAWTSCARRRSPTGTRARGWPGRDRRGARATGPSFAGGAALHALAEAALDVVLRVAGLVLDALAEAALVLELDLGADALPAREVGFQLLVGQVGLVVDALGEAVVRPLLGLGGMLVLGDLLELVQCFAVVVVAFHGGTSVCSRVQLRGTRRRRGRRS